MKIRVHFGVWIALAVAVIATIAGCSLTSRKPADTEKIFTQAQVYFDNGELEAAEPLFWNAAQSRETDGNAWFFAGLTSHYLGHYEKSISAFQKSQKLQYRPAMSTYNIACGLALSGKDKEALDSLEIAVQQGFNRPETISTDPDLKSLHDDARYEALMAKMESPADSVSTIKDMEVRDGEWEVRTVTGRYLGTMQSTSELGGYVRQEYWSGEDGRQTMIVFTYDKEKDTWNQVYADDKGVSYSREGKQEKGELIFTRTRPDKVLEKFTWRSGDNGLVQEIATSKDGKFWTPETTLALIPKVS